MSLTVLNVAYPFAPVGPDAVGGAEQVLTQLDAALVAAGHRSVVVACEGSVTAGALLATPAAKGLLTSGQRAAIREAHRRAIELALREFRVDVVHLHGVDFTEYLPRPGVPVLVTLHLPPSWYPGEAFRLDRAGTYLHCVSASQRRACPPCGALLAEIENGVPIEALTARHAKRRYAVALGRICPEKNWHEAMEAAAKADIPLLLAGRVFPYEAHERYFREQIGRRLDRRRRFVGPVGFARKRRLLASARCLLLPSLAAETSSLVAMEALACGTPVVAYPAGAVTEIVEHGVTGFIVHSVSEMAAAIERAGALDPEACRRVARRRFGAERMTAQYLARYGWLAGEGAGGAAVRIVGRPEPARKAVNGSKRVRVEEVSSLWELERLAGEWDQLWRGNGATPFQSPHWLIPWWRHVGQGRLLSMAVRDAEQGGTGRLVGLAPAYVQAEDNQAGSALYLLGISTSDYLGGVFAAGWEERATEGVLRHLNASANRWRVCDWQQLEAGSPLLRAEIPAGWRERTSEGLPCAELRLDAGSGDGGLPAAVPRSMRLRFERARRRALRAGRLTLDTATERTVEEVFDALVRLHRVRWAGRRSAGVMADAGVERAHREALPGLLGAGVLRLQALRLDGRVVAVLYGLADRDGGEGRVYSYVSGFDPECARLSPGTLAIGLAIEDAVRSGMKVFDFLRGRERYKYEWGAVDRPTSRRELWHSPPGEGADAACDERVSGVRIGGLIAGRAAGPIAGSQLE